LISNCLPFSIGLPSRATTTSPTRKPAFSAGLPGNTSPRITPRSRGSARAADKAGVIVCAITPMVPRRTVPVDRNCSKMFLTMLLGAANPMPSLPPEREKIKVLIPTTRPLASTKGPPLLPGLIGASVWM
jgi:hypothetical protein